MEPPLSTDSCALYTHAELDEACMDASMAATEQTYAHCQAVINGKDATILTLKEFQDLSYKALELEEDWLDYDNLLNPYGRRRAFVEKCLIQFEMTHYQEAAPIMQDPVARGRRLDAYDQVMSSPHLLTLIFEQTLTDLDKFYGDDNFNARRTAAKCISASARLMQTCKLAYDIGKEAGFPKRSQEVCEEKFKNDVRRVKRFYFHDLHHFWPSECVSCIPDPHRIFECNCGTHDSYCKKCGLYMACQECYSD